MVGRWQQQAKEQARRIFKVRWGTVAKGQAGGVFIFSLSLI